MPPKRRTRSTQRKRRTQSPKSEITSDEHNSSPSSPSSSPSEINTDIDWPIDGRNLEKAARKFSPLDAPLTRSKTKDAGVEPSDTSHSFINRRRRGTTSKVREDRVSVEMVVDQKKKEDSPLPSEDDDGAGNETDSSLSVLDCESESDKEDIIAEERETEQPLVDAPHQERERHDVSDRPPTEESIQQVGPLADIPDSIGPQTERFALSIDFKSDPQQESNSSNGQCGMSQDDISASSVQQVDIPTDLEAPIDDPTEKGLEASKPATADITNFQQPPIPPAHSPAEAFSPYTTLSPSQSLKPAPLPIPSLFPIYSRQIPPALPISKAHANTVYRPANPSPLGRSPPLNKAISPFLPNSNEVVKTKPGLNNENFSKMMPRSLEPVEAQQQSQVSLRPGFGNGHVSQVVKINPQWPVRSIPVNPGMAPASCFHQSAVNESCNNELDSLLPRRARGRGRGSRGGGRGSRGGKRAATTPSIALPSSDLISNTQAQAQGTVRESAGGCSTAPRKRKRAEPKTLRTSKKQKEQEERKNDPYVGDDETDGEPIPPQIPQVLQVPQKHAFPSWSHSFSILSKFVALVNHGIPPPDAYKAFLSPLEGDAVEALMYLHVGRSFAEKIQQVVKSALPKVADPNIIELTKSSPRRFVSKLVSPSP